MGVRLVGDQSGALETLLSLSSPLQERRPVICEGIFLAILEVPIRSAEACAHESLLVTVLHNGLAAPRGAPNVRLRGSPTFASTPSAEVRTMLC